MSDSKVVIASAGVVTPIGLSLAETAASARARVARVHEVEWLDRQFEPYIGGVVPHDGLPELTPPLDLLPLQPREARMLCLAHAAMEEALASLPAPRAAIPLLLGLPEQHTAIPLDCFAFLRRLDVQVPESIDVDRSIAVARGRAGALLALNQAAKWLTEGQCEYILVGGVDSLVDPYVLGTLDVQQRIRNDANSDGLRPSEGAGFLLLALQDTCKDHGQQGLACVLGSALGHEIGHLYSNVPYLGDGLAATIGTLLAQTPMPSPIGCVFNTFNGERYWAREYGVARLRHAPSFISEQQLEHPAECFGDLGAAHGPVIAALAAHGVRHGYRNEPCLVYASSDYGDRAALLLVQST